MCFSCFLSLLSFSSSSFSFWLLSGRFHSGCELKLKLSSWLMRDLAFIPGSDQLLLAVSPRKPTGRCLAPAVRCTVPHRPYLPILSPFRRSDVNPPGCSCPEKGAFVCLRSARWTPSGLHRRVSCQLIRQPLARPKHQIASPILQATHTHKTKRVPASLPESGESLRLGFPHVQLPCHLINPSPTTNCHGACCMSAPAPLFLAAAARRLAVTGSPRRLAGRQTFLLLSAGSPASCCMDEHGRSALSTEHSRIAGHTVHSAGTYQSSSFQALSMQLRKLQAQAAPSSQLCQWAGLLWLTTSDLSEPHQPDCSPHPT